MNGRLLLALALCSIGALSLGEERRVTVKWGSGHRVDAVISYPKGAGKFPAVVIASGRSGGMESPIVKGLAQRAVKAGIAAVRFDYAYFTAKGEPSKGVVAEAEEARNVLAAIKTDPRIDAGRIVLAGKSLGSVVAHAVFNQDSSVRGEVLLTPVVTTQDQGNRLYPGLSGSYRPIAIILGNKDQDNAPLGTLYNFLKDASLRVSVNVVAGDHGLNVVDESNRPDPKQTQMAHDTALNLAVYWLRTMLENKLPY